METTLERPPDKPDTGLAIQYTERELTLLTIAKSLRTRRPLWTEFFREIFGVEGAIRRLYKTPEELAEFEKAPAYAELQDMLVELRETQIVRDPHETTRVITVRMPKSMHAALRTEAHERKTSMNQLCISKLLQVLEADLVAH